jgi:glutamine cyclotransferase
MRNTSLMAVRTAVLLGPAVMLCTVAEPSENQARQSRPAASPVASYRIVKIYPHDRAAFTEGLFYLDGVLY